MVPERKSFVTFYYNGGLFEGERTYEAQSRDPECIKVPKGAFAFQFFDRAVATPNIDGKSIEMSSKPFNLSPKYYYGGRVLTIKDVEKEIPDNETLISNMRGNGWKTVIQTRCGNIQPLEGSHILIEETV